MASNNSRDGNRGGNSAGKRGGRYVPPQQRNISSGGGSNSSSRQSDYGSQHGRAGYNYRYEEQHSVDGGRYNDRRNDPVVYDLRNDRIDDKVGGDPWTNVGYRLGGGGCCDRRDDRSYNNRQGDGRRLFGHSERGPPPMNRQFLNDDRDKNRDRTDCEAQLSTSSREDDDRRGEGRNDDGRTKTPAKKEPDREGGSRLSEMSSVAPVPSFKETLQTLRVQHVVVQVGQRIMLFVFTTLFLGKDLNNIKGFVSTKLGSNRQYKDSFTTPEKEKLEEGDYKKWDISLLFKLLQKICGLNPYVSEWKKLGKDAIEKLLDELKDLRNEMAHLFNCILTKEQRDKKLEDFCSLCLEILMKLGEEAKLRSVTVSHNDINQHQELILSTIEDTNKEINESPDIIFPSTSTAGTIPKNVPAAAASPAFGFASASIASASASADYSKGVYSAAACADSAIFGGDLSPNYDHDGYEMMDVDSFEPTSGEESIINQLILSFWNYAGQGIISV